MSQFPARLYHATHRRNLESICANGLQVARYGEVHGAMDYRPAGPSVYLSSNPSSGNLNTDLFNEGIEAVILIEIDPAHLDPELVYPDDLLMFILDEEFLADCDGPEDLEDGVIMEFAARFSLDEAKARRILTAALAAPDESGYPAVLKEMWGEYLSVEGEIAYLGDIPPEAIAGWRDYPQPASELQPLM